MAIRTVTIKIRIKTAEGKRVYANPVWEAKGRLKRLWARLNGKGGFASRGVYVLRYGDRWEFVGQEIDVVMATKLRREQELEDASKSLAPITAVPAATQTGPAILPALELPCQESQHGPHYGDIWTLMADRVQHIALLSGDAVKTVGELQGNGIEFLRVPDSYYDVVRDRVGRIDESLDAIRFLGILVDRDQEGYLLQIFSKPVEDRPTLFFEIIQRKGSRGFGKGNFRVLFEAIETRQARPGKSVGDYEHKNHSPSGHRDLVSIRFRKRICD